MEIITPMNDRPASTRVARCPLTVVHIAALAFGVASSDEQGSKTAI